jgi:signal transduction histidine kinase
MTAEARSTPPPALDAEELGQVLREYMEVAGRLQHTHEALQGEVLRLRQELASKDRELEMRRRLAALGELAAGVAHEVRNPLGAIQLYSDLLRHECHTHQLLPALQLIEKIEAGIHAIDAVVTDTLALAPRERQLGVCRVADLLARARDASLKVLTDRRVRLELPALADDLHVHADENGLQRVLVNLIVNAAEASPPDATIEVQAAAAAEQLVEIRVRDHGPGLPDDLLERIFEPFFTTKPQGTGLGLTIAHRLIEAYGGRLTAGNRPAGGAEFVIQLPRAVAAGAPASSASATPRADAA